MKRRADLLIDGVYKRITIWDALDYKQNHPELWDVYKENIYSICKNPQNKVRMVFQTGKNGVLKIAIFVIITQILNIRVREAKNHIDMNFLKNVFLE